MTGAQVADLRVRPEDAAAISDEEFLGLFRGALGG